MNNRRNFPLLWWFLEGALQTNSGGHITEESTVWTAHPIKLLAIAETELQEFLAPGAGVIHDRAFQLGHQADNGYSVSLNGKQLEAFTILDGEY